MIDENGLNLLRTAIVEQACDDARLLLKKRKKNITKTEQEQIKWKLDSLRVFFRSAWFDELCGSKLHIDDAWAVIMKGEKNV